MPATVFGSQFISSVKYRHEKATFTAGPMVLPPGSTTIFDVSGWDQNYMAVLESLAATQNPGVQLYWSYDGSQASNAQGYTDALPNGLAPYPVHAEAVARLALFANNLTGAAIANFQLNYEITVKRMSIADKIMRGYPLTAADELALSALNPTENNNALGSLQALVKKGRQPLSFERIYEIVFSGRKAPDPGQSTPIHLTTANAVLPAQFTFTVPSNKVYVLEAIGVEATPAVTVEIDRDDQVPYLLLNGAAFATAQDTPFGLFVPFAKSLVLSVYGATGTFLVRPQVRAYQLSDLIALHLGLANTPAELNNKVLAGLS